MRGARSCTIGFTKSSRQAISSCLECRRNDVTQWNRKKAGRTAKQRNQSFRGEWMTRPGEYKEVEQAKLKRRLKKGPQNSSGGLGFPFFFLNPCSLLRLDGRGTINERLVCLLYKDYETIT